ncbi:putative F-box domain-containing protein [Seiridium cardinale]|uniref:F-box domain-containing protein n=1 Tax=Seiridium cardinale TaxID=138064 RepID=A0ABR2XA19_9PEZI
MPNFTDLPYEIRLDILEGLLKGVRNSNSTSADHLPIFAVVCKEWQNVFERETFRQLILSPSRVRDLYQNIKHRKAYVKHIHYYVELTKYPCGACASQESPERISANNVIATREISQLFEVLSHWSENGACTKDDLTLELSSFSPSDSKHYFKNHQFDAFFYSDHDDFSQNPRARRLTPRVSDGSHRWDHAHDLVPQHPIPLNLLARWRVHGKPLEIQQKLSKVEVVTRLLIRRQSYRAFGPKALRHILESLPRLRQIHVESWRSLFHLSQLGLDAGEYQDMEVLLRRCMPTMLKELTLYEDYDGFYELFETNINRSSLPQFATTILDASTQLESLAVSFVIDARDFFHPLSPTKDLALPNFPRLQFVILTSHELSLDKSPKAINNLLYAAGNTALKMPKLQVMELWNGRRGEAAIFRSWDFVFDPEVVNRWREVAFRHRCAELVTKSDRIPAPPICPGSILKYLYLRHRILSPLSLYQIQQEADEAQDAQAWGAASSIA